MRCSCRVALAVVVVLAATASAELSDQCEEGPESGQSHHRRLLHGQAGADPWGGLNVAYLMMYSMAGMMMLICFMSYRDPDIRVASSKTARIAISVYCAVLINSAIDAVIKQVLTGKGDRGLNLDHIQGWMRFSIGCVVFLVMLLGMNMQCWRWQKKPDRFVASAQLGAHLVAWAGIYACTGVLDSEAMEDMSKQLQTDAGGPEVIDSHIHIKYLLVILAGFGAFIVMFMLTDAFRARIMGPGYHDAHKQEEPLLQSINGPPDVANEEGRDTAAIPRSLSPAVSTGKSEVEADPRSRTTESVGSAAGMCKSTQSLSRSGKEEAPCHGCNSHKHWVLEMKDAEKEAMSLVLAFLTQQYIVYLVTDSEKIPMHGLAGKRKLGEVIAMGGCAVSAFLLLLLVSCLSSSSERSRFNWRGYLGMTMAWLYCRSGEWAWHLWECNLSVARIWSAFSVTLFCIINILLIDHFADGMLVRKKRDKEAKYVTLEDLLTMEREDRQAAGTAGARDGKPGEHERTSIDDDGCSKRKSLKDAVEATASLDIKLESLASGFSVLIGVVWESAFEMAEQTIVTEGTAERFMVQHYVVARCFLAAILCSVVLPGWVYYIVPHSRKVWRHHLMDIQLEKDRAVSTGEEDDDCM